MRVKEESEKAGLKINIQKTKILAFNTITSCKQKGEKWKQWQILFSWAPKSLWMVTVDMKLKDTCSWEEKLTNLDNISKSRDITLPTKVHRVEASYGLSISHAWI